MNSRQKVAVNSGKRLRYLLLLVAVSGFLQMGSAKSQGEAGGWLIHAGTVMTSPAEPLLKNQTIVVRGGHIESIVQGFDVIDKTLPVLDLKNEFVMAGMIDTHVHLTTIHLPGVNLSPISASDSDLAIVAAVSANKIFRAGFTTVMDLGNGQRQHEQAVYALRDAIADGQLPGPEILAAGSPIAAIGFARNGRLNDKIEPVAGPEGTCAGADACRQRVLEQLHRGADFINVYHSGSLLQEPSPSQTLNDAELGAIIEAAHMADSVVIADGGNNRETAQGTNRAIELGFRIIDTVTYPDRDTFELLNQHNGFFAPHVYALEASVGDTLESLEQGSMGWLPRPILKKLYSLKQEKPSALTGYQAGATLVLASDSGVFPHGDNANELLAYERLSIRPLDALAAATINAAKAFHIDHRTGTIAPGKEADIVMFAENPLTDMTTVLEPLKVMSDGRVIHLRITL